MSKSRPDKEKNRKATEDLDDELSDEQVYSSTIVYDDNGDPIEEDGQNYSSTIVYDDNGDPIEEDVQNYSSTIVYDDNGDPIEEDVQNYSSTVVYDDNGDRIEDDEQIYSSTVVYDDNGDPIEDDDQSYSSTVVYDSNGVPIKDEDTSPRPSVETETKRSTQDLADNSSEDANYKPERVNPPPRPIKKYQIGMFQQKQEEHNPTEKISHTTHKASRKGKEWYIKKIVADNYTPDPEVIAKREVLAQEIIRLIDPKHPKTKLIRNQIGEVFVASKAIEQGRSLQDVYKAEKSDLVAKITSGEYTGLGTAAVIAVYMCENDFKLGNLYMNNNNEFIKIDGDWCFAAIREKEMGVLGTGNFTSQRFEITADNIEQLPCSGDYACNNWLDERTAMLLREDDRIILARPDLAFDIGVRQEINETMLKVMLLPEELLKDMVDLHFPKADIAEQQQAFIEEEAKKPFSLDDLDTQSPQEILSEQVGAIVKALLGRQGQLASAAMQNKDFLSFISSPDAEKVCEQFAEQVMKFSPAGSMKEKLNVDYTKDMRNLLDDLREYASKDLDSNSPGLNK